MCYTLHRGCSYAVAVYTAPGNVYAVLPQSGTVHLTTIAIYCIPHSPHISLALRCCQLIQYSLRFGYIACRCICFSIIIFHRSDKHCRIFTLSSTMPSHQQIVFPSSQNGSVRVDALGLSHQRHSSGGLLSAWCQYHLSYCILPSDHGLTITRRSVGVLVKTNTLALWPIVTKRRNGFIGYVLGSGLQCDWWHCDNLSSRQFYLRTKCNSLFTNYTHHSRLQDRCDYWQSIPCSVRLLSYN